MDVTQWIEPNSNKRMVCTVFELPVDRTLSITRMLFNLSPDESTFPGNRCYFVNFVLIDACRLTSESEYKPIVVYKLYRPTVQGLYYKLVRSSSRSRSGTAQLTVLYLPHSIAQRNHYHSVIFRCVFGHLRKCGYQSGRLFTRWRKSIFFGSPFTCQTHQVPNLKVTIH